MFCEKCGTQIPEDAAFCPNCGASTSGEINPEITKKEKIEDNEIQLKVKPTFKWGVALYPFFITLIIILIVMLPIAFVSFTTGIGVLVAMLVFAVFMGLIYLIQALINKKQIENYTYDFYKTKVIYKDSFINLAEKEVKYKNIREITMRQTFFQRLFNLGTIILFTNAETGFGNGIFINNVENVKDVYNQIKTVVEI